MINSHDRMAVLSTALREGSQMAMSARGHVEGTIKDSDPNQVVTDADVAIGRAIQAHIRQSFPQDAVLDEEIGFQAGTSEYTWVIDPIDGTSNFATGVPLFGVMIGVLLNGEPVVGGIALPALEETYLAEAGSGALCNGVAIQVTTAPELTDVLVAWGVDGDRNNRDRTFTEARCAGEIALAARNLRCSNSVFDQMMVARGSYGGCVNFSSKIWDNVAPQIIITEAGGIYSDLRGQPLPYRSPGERMNQIYQWVAASQELHPQLVAITQAYASR